MIAALLPAVKTLILSFRYFIASVVGYLEPPDVLFFMYIFSK